jgi:predicted GNAT family acetyltransferase
LAFDGDVTIGTACMRRIGPDTAEIKRMYVQPSHRGAGMGRALLEQLIEAARRAGYERVSLDSPDFMTAPHGLYRASGFMDIGPYPESEIADEYKTRREPVYQVLDPSYCAGDDPFVQHWSVLGFALRRAQPPGDLEQHLGGDRGLAPEQSEHRRAVEAKRQHVVLGNDRRRPRIAAPAGEATAPPASVSSPATAARAAIRLHR